MKALGDADGDHSLGFGCVALGRVVAAKGRKHFLQFREGLGGFELTAFLGLRVELPNDTGRSKDFSVEGNPVACLAEGILGNTENLLWAKLAWGVTIQGGEIESVDGGVDASWIGVASISQLAFERLVRHRNVFLVRVRVS